MSRQNFQAFSSFDVPNTHCFIERTRDNHVRLRIKVDAEDIVGVAVEGFDQRTSGNVPETERFVVGSRNKEPGVGGEGDVGDALVVAGVFMDRSESGSGGGERVGTEGFVGGGGGEEAAVGGEFDG